ncbi:MAG: DUF1653 domain-containing protein [Clostridiales bacterium]|jgi:cyclomaltodextrinase|nr:DUF1653 domain-containing protein [Clostridiales bacterium]
MAFWYENAIVYHIYPLGFCGASKFNENENVVYSLDKIYDWIESFKELNIDAIYFGPVFESVEHGYDTINYKVIDKRLGDNESFKKICKELHNNGIRVILDGVFNHVGREFWAFKDVQEKGHDSAYCGWFHNLHFGNHSPYGDNFSYEGWNGHYNLVKLNLKNPDVCDYLLDVINYWIDEFNIDGIRFDAADCIDFDFFKKVRNFCKNKKFDFWLMGEIIHGDYNRWANPEMLDSVTNYECYKGIYSSHNDKNYFEIDYSINRQKGAHGIYKNIHLYNFVDNHDVNRIISMLKNKEHIFNCYTLLYTMPGIPSIYYGSEYGIAGVKENNSDDNLRPCLEIDKMPKSSSLIYHHLVKLGKIYKTYHALSTGSYETIIIRNQQMLFKREADGEVVYVALNLEDKEFEFSFNTNQKPLFDILNNLPVIIENDIAKIKVPAFSAAIIAHNDAVNKPIKNLSQDSIFNEIIVGGKYMYCGIICEVIAIARDVKTMEEVIIYRDPNFNIWSTLKSTFIVD